MLAVDYTRRAESIVEREEADARRARLHAAETAFEAARARREDVERRKADAVRGSKALRARLVRLAEALTSRIAREDEKIAAIEAGFDREWEDADDACMAAHDAWTEEISR